MNNTIAVMESKIEDYINVNINAHIYMRGKACMIVMDHCEDVRTKLKKARGSEEELKNILDFIGVV